MGSISDLGDDGRIGEKSDETRTDSIMVVNVNNKEGKIKMVSFMRDTLVHIDGVSQQNILNMMATMIKN